MAKEIMILSCKEIRENLFVTDSASEAYSFALKSAGFKMDDDEKADFIVQRNAKSGWRDLWELKAWCEKTAQSIKEMCKHSFNVGSEDELPNFVKWAKQSFSYEFVEGAGSAVANALISKRLVTKDQLLNMLTVSSIVKASGLTTEKLIEMFPDTIVEKPKERALNMK